MNESFAYLNLLTAEDVHDALLDAMRTAAEVWGCVPVIFEITPCDEKPGRIVVRNGLIH